MGRLVLIVLMMIVSGVVFLFKKGASVVTGKDVSFKDESTKVMNNTAKGVNWMNDQWDKAKYNAGMDNSLFSNMTAFEIITKIKANSVLYDTKKSRFDLYRASRGKNAK